MNDLQPSLSQPKALVSDKNNAEAYLEALRWPDGVVCPSCGSTEFQRRGRGSGAYRCKECERAWTIRQGTCMEGSKSKIGAWAAACWLYESGLRGEQFCEKLEEISGLTKATPPKILERLEGQGLPSPSCSVPPPPQVLPKPREVGKSRAWSQSINLTLGTLKRFSPHIASLLAGALVTLAAVFWAGIKPAGVVHSAPPRAPHEVSEFFVGKITLETGENAFVSYVDGIRIQTPINESKPEQYSLDRHHKCAQYMRSRLMSDYAVKKQVPTE